MDESNGEALHSLARQLFFGRLGELRDRALEDQIHRASYLHLLIAAIAAWNTIYLSRPRSRRCVGKAKRSQRQPSRISRRWAGSTSI
ncbi:MAG TPA: Tn3 family transposase [Ktedonobacteraceae bacterium]|nr:Tn3 family transposase [Ktedonobacteraceae bacterium]